MIWGCPLFLTAVITLPMSVGIRKAQRLLLRTIHQLSKEMEEICSYGSVGSGMMRTAERRLPGGYGQHRLMATRWVRFVAFVTVARLHSESS